MTPFESLKQIPSYYHLLVVQYTYNHLNSQGMDMDDDNFKECIQYFTQLVQDVLKIHKEHADSPLDGDKL